MPVFVISSGRTGSTFLARLIRDHPRLLCVSDLFEPVGKVPYFDRRTQIDGPSFFKVLSAPSFPQRIAYWRWKPNAELLFLPEDDNLVSLLLSYTLPFVTEQPLELYREVKEAVCRFPTRSMADQTIAFFDFLRDRFNKEIWVERTGGSLPHTREIIQTWPHARFIHNFRDPREVSLSMMTGSFFRLYLELEKNPDLGTWDWNYMPPIEEMGSMLNKWVLNAMDAFAQLPKEQHHNLRYEDLMSDPEGTLLSLAQFFLGRDNTDEDRQWAQTQAARIRPSGPKFDKLEPQERSALENAVAPAMDILGYKT